MGIRIQPGRELRGPLKPTQAELSKTKEIMIFNT